jgi:predicted neuraminidase
MRSTILTLILTLNAFAAEEPFIERKQIFEPPREGFHAHASCVVECPNGDLLSIWYENGELMPPPYYSDRKDKSDDVRIGASRLRKGNTEWDKTFVIADTFGVSDNNPCMIIDNEERLWIFYPTLTGVPDWTWGSGLLRYRVSADYMEAEKPSWIKSDVLIPHVEGIAEIAKETFAKRGKAEGWAKDRIEEYQAGMEERLKNPLITRLGFMCRAHPLIRSDGTLLLPVSNENLSVPVIAMTSDVGETWTFSEPVPEAGLTQPTLVEFDDKSMAAFFRNGYPEHRIRRSDSTDGGKTWSKTTITDLIHPGAGIEALLLANGNLLMIYNDVEDSPRDKLAVSISDDRGKTWKWTRHLEDTDGERFDYPSIVQAKDGTLHTTYTYGTETIRYARFNEAWVREGD